MGYVDSLVTGSPAVMFIVQIMGVNQYQEHKECTWVLCKSVLANLPPKNEWRNVTLSRTFQDT